MEDIPRSDQRFRLLLAAGEEIIHIVKEVKLILLYVFIFFIRRNVGLFDKVCFSPV
jgi:hypothetical protein